MMSGQIDLSVNPWHGPALFVLKEACDTAFLIIDERRFPVRIVRDGHIVMEVEIDQSFLTLSGLALTPLKTSETNELIANDKMREACAGSAPAYQLQNWRRTSTRHFNLILRRCREQT